VHGTTHPPVEAPGGPPGDVMDSVFPVERLGVVMEPDPQNPLAAMGVLNPAVARDPRGDLYLFPRIVAEGNFSRIGRARVRFNEAGDPVGVERLGYAVQPSADYERNRGRDD